MNFFYRFSLFLVVIFVATFYGSQEAFAAVCPNPSPNDYGGTSTSMGVGIDAVKADAYSTAKSDADAYLGSELESQRSDCEDFWSGTFIKDAIVYSPNNANDACEEGPEPIEDQWMCLIDEASAVWVCCDPQFGGP